MNDHFSPHSPSRKLLPSLLEWGCAFAIILVLTAFLLPATRGVRPVKRSQCKNNLKQIGLALHNYHEKWGSLPPAYTVDAEGRPLHSWRVLLLPYLDHQTVYDKIDLTKPWDDPANAEVRKLPIVEYRCPSADGPPTQTNYVALVGEEIAFAPTRPRSFTEFKDGLGGTVLIMEVSSDESFDWMDPRDGNEQTFLRFNSETKTSHTGGIHVLIADGSVRFLNGEVPEKQRRALLTIDAGDQVGEF